MMSLSNSFDVVLFPLSSLVTGQVSCQYHHCFWSYDNFLLQGIDQKSWNGKYLFEFSPISEGWDELGIPDVAGMPLIKCYWMLQNASVAAFTVWVIKGKPTGGKITPDLD